MKSLFPIRNFFVFVLMNFAYIQIYGQYVNDVITHPDAPQPGLEFFENLNLKSASLYKTIRVYLIFQKNANGEGPSDTETSRTIVMNSLNSGINQLGLSAELTGHEQKNNVNFSTQDFLTHYFYSNLPFPHPNDFVIILTPLEHLDSGWAGLGVMGYPVMAIDDNYLASITTYIHEFGHCTGLYHTCYQTKYNTDDCSSVRGELNNVTTCALADYGINQTTPEYVTNTRLMPNGKVNGLVGGDFIMDTPADPASSGHFDEYMETYISFNNIMKTTGSTNINFTTDQKKVVLSHISDKVYNRIFRKTIIGTDTVLSGTSEPYILEDEAPAPCYALTWTCTNNTGGVSINPSTGVLSVNSTTAGTETITATIKVSYYYNTLPSSTTNVYITKSVFILAKPQINVQTPLAYYTNGAYNTVCNSQNYTTNISVIGATNTTWWRIAASPENTSWYQTGDNLSFYFWAVNQTAVFRITASNACGIASYDFGFKSVSCGTDPCNPVYTISPNPAIDQSIVIIDIPAPCDLSNMQSTSFNGYVAVFDNQGNLKKKLHYKKYGNIKLDLSDMENGLHHIEIYDGKTKQNKTILIQK